MREYLAQRIAAGATDDEILGLRPAGQSMCHPMMRDTDGGALLIDN